MSNVVLITGGTSGIGLAMAEAFVEKGNSVAVCGRSEAALARFSQAHPNALTIQADVTSAAARAAMLDEVAAQFGRLDILVNNAGTFVERDFTAGIDAAGGIDEEIALNLTAPIKLTSEAVERWGDLKAIVFVTSGFALISPTRAPTYGAVKAGLHAFAEGIRGQLEPKGTLILEVFPSLTDTPMNARMSGRKMPPSVVAEITLSALAAGRSKAFAGPARLLPTLLRIAPKTITRMVAKT